MLINYDSLLSKQQNTLSHSLWRVNDLVEEDEYETDGEYVDGEEGDQAVAGGRLTVGTGLAGLGSVAPAGPQLTPYVYQRIKSKERGVYKGGGG